MGLNVGQLILTRVSEGGSAQCHSGILVCGIHLRRLAGIRDQFVDIGHLQLLEHPVHHSTLIKNLREGLRQLQNRLHLRHALGLREDVRVADGHNIAVALEVFAFDWQLCHHITTLLLVQVPAVQASNDANDSALALVQARVDRGEHHSALLDQRLRGSHRHRRFCVGDLLFGGSHHALCGVSDPAQQLEQHFGRRVERHGHRDLADVVHAGGTLHLGNLSHLDLLTCARDACALQLQHRGRVVDVRSVQQGP